MLDGVEPVKTGPVGGGATVAPVEAAAATAAAAAAETDAAPKCAYWRAAVSAA